MNDRMDALNEIIGRTSRRRTICEVWREVFFLTYKMGDEELATEMRARILDGFIMGKKMNDRLTEYKKDWESGVFPENKDFDTDMMNRQQFLDQLHEGDV